MSFNSPQETALQAVSAGYKKTQTPLIPLLVLGFMAGAFIAIGFLLDIRITGTMPAEWGGLRTFIGASVFPIGLVLTLIAGGELLTGNMLTLPMALFSRQIGAAALLRNWVLVTVSNFAGSLAVAFFFGHFLGLTEGDFLASTVSIAQHKVDADFWHAFVSGVGCNWPVWPYGSATPARMWPARSSVSGSPSWHSWRSVSSTSLPTCSWYRRRFSPAR